MTLYKLNSQECPTCGDETNTLHDYVPYCSAACQAYGRNGERGLIDYIKNRVALAFDTHVAYLDTIIAIRKIEKIQARRGVQ